MQHRLVSFDIACARRRTRISRLLGAHGQRIQASVFIVATRDAEWNAICVRIARTLDPATDRWRAWPLCRSDLNDLADLGRPSPEVLPRELIT